jgi:hypothetical protein
LINVIITATAVAPERKVAHLVALSATTAAIIVSAIKETPAYTGKATI